MNMTDHSHRLPTTIRPSRYDLALRPDIESATFSGSVGIDLNIDQPTSTITVHALDLEFSSVTLSHAGAAAHVSPTSIEFDTENEWAVLTFADEVPAGSARLDIAFAGVLNDLLVGFYRSVMSQRGDDHDSPDSQSPLATTLAVTQFEATHARRAFPCFDEPAFKAVFSISLTIPDGLLGISNAAEISRRAAEDGWVRIDFADTIPMSTYLVAVVVGNLESTPTHMIQGRENEIPLRVIYPPGNAHLCDFAIEVADHTVRYFEDYYELPYPGDKIDLVAIPDFAFGAMENLGCITFREVLLLVDPDKATQPELQRVADVINHELAHMWFGDLVTMNWWNGIWLNEAFATFMEVKASEAFRPEWDVWTTFGLARSPAFETDSLHTTRPIEFEVVTAADSEAMFDILTYEKGASVVRMLEQHLGEATFRKGIAAYLKKHAFGNTETTDLWDAIEELSGEPAREIMDSWIFQGGFPLVRVHETSSSFTLSQERFLFIPDESALDVDGEEFSDSADNSNGEPRGSNFDEHGIHPGSWTIPLTLSQFDLETDTLRSEPQHVLMASSSTRVDRRHELLQPNAEGTGFYRSLLPSEQVINLMLHPETTRIERFSMLDDVWATFLSGHRSIDDALVVLDTVAQVINNPSDEIRTGPALLKRFSAVLVEGAHLSSGNQVIHERFVALAATATASVSQQFNGLSPTDTVALLSDLDATEIEVRSVLYGLSGRLGNSEIVINHARNCFNDPALDLLPAAFSTAVLSVVAFRADAAEHNEILQRSQAAPTPQEQLRYLHALVGTDDATLFAQTIDYALHEVRTQNAPYLLRAALEHRDFGEHCWDKIVENWDHITQKFPSNSLPRMLDGIRSFTHQDTADAVTAFLAEHPIPSGEKQIAQHIERMSVSVRAAQRITR